MVSPKRKFARDSLHCTMDLEGRDGNKFLTTIWTHRRLFIFINEKAILADSIKESAWLMPSDVWFSLACTWNQLSDGLR